jgi:2,3-bisphosphoglycerate-dependent phosphoglycerate mutase
MPTPARLITLHRLRRCVEDPTMNTSIVQPARPADRQLRFVRHGATEPNRAALRCGGDLDVPLTETGRAQAALVAHHIAALRPPVGVLVTSALQRTQETAHIIASVLGGVPVVVEPLFAERHLGEWNLLPVASTQAWLDERLTPPGGEADADFVARIAQAVQTLAPLWPQRPLLVSSQGVARALAELSGWPGRIKLDNAAVVEFDLARLGARPAAQDLPACGA